MGKTVRKLFTVVLMVLLAAFAVTAVACDDGESVSHTHTYSAEWSADENNHWHASTCGHVNELGDKAAHAFSAVTVDPTCTEGGYTEHKCACGYSYRDAEVDALGHELTVVSLAPSDCATEGKTEYHCSRCDTDFTEILPVSETHTYSQDWLYEGEYHWHATTCIHTHEKINYETHDYEDIAHDATCTEIGYTEKVCKKCGYSRIDEDSYTDYGDHTYDTQWSSNATIHYRTSTCEHSVRTDVADHNYNSGNICTQCRYKLRPTEGMNYTNNGTYFYVASIGNAVSATDIVVPAYATDSNNNTTTEVTALGQSVFSGNKTIESVIIPGTVTKIFNQAFEKCTALKYVYIPASVTDISGAQVFEGSTSIEKIEIAENNPKYKVDGNCIIDKETDTLIAVYGDYEIPDYVKTIGSRVFANATFTEFTMPASVTTLGDSAFTGCKSLTTIDFGNVETIGGSAFNGCSELSSIDLPGVKSIGASSFAYCTSLTSVSLGSELKTLNVKAFNFSKAIETLTVADGNPTFSSSGNCILKGNVVVLGCKTSVIPSTATEIGESAFARLDITSISVPDTVKTIGKDAFTYSSKLKSVTIGAGVTKIDTNAFSGTGLTSATFAVTTGWKCGTAAVTDFSNMSDICSKLKNGKAWSRTVA